MATAGQMAWVLKQKIPLRRPREEIYECEHLVPNGLRRKRSLAVILAGLCEGPP